MPKDYSMSKIYMIEPIVEHDERDIYIGSTTKRLLSHRMCQHRTEYRRWKKGTHKYMNSFLIFEKYELENCKIILIESFPCTNNDELRSREVHYQKTLKCVNQLTNEK